MAVQMSDGHGEPHPGVVADFDRPGVYDADGARPGSGAALKVTDPSTAEVLGELAAASPEDVDSVVASSAAALTSRWAAAAPAQRGRLVREIGLLIERDADRLVSIIVHDAGLPVSVARADVAAAARYFEFYAGLADKLHGISIPLGEGFADFTQREPWGVCAAVLPFNVPLQMAARSLAPALISGNTVVIKPAEQAPFAPLALVDLCREAGIPPGVATAVAGPGEVTGRRLVEHPLVDHVTFTGSLATGQQIMRSAADGMKPVLLELGGKSPQIVFADADLDKAYPAIMNSVFRTAGQACSAGTRVLVEARRFDEVASKLGELVSQLRVAPALDDPDVGPVITERQRDTIQQAIARSIAAGADRTSAHQGPDLSGYFVAPTVLAATSADVPSAREEIFGPVITVVPFADEAEALELANDSEFGLVAGIWTREVGTAHRVAAKVRAGQVFINTYGVGGGVELPFGGYKRSGFGRLKGTEAAFEYTQLKNICIDMA